MTSATERLRAARDGLLAAHDLEQAVRDFAWPNLGRRFNWALDWFDAIARDNLAPALHIIGADGTSRRYSFDTLSRRSDQVAAWLRVQGVVKGVRVILMLGNQVELWECMLAVAKLGAVIMPTPIALGPTDLADRMEHGNPRFVITNADQVAKFDHVPGGYRRITVGRAVPGCLPYTQATAVETGPSRHPGTVAEDPMLLYFTCGTTGRPKLVEHSQVSHPAGHLSTMYWIGLRPGDIHLSITAPGWAEHAGSSFFAPWIAEATIVTLDRGSSEALGLLQQLKTAGVTTFCAPPAVWRMLARTDLSPRADTLREVVSTGERLDPEIIDQVRRAWGLTIREGYGQTETTAQIGHTPGSVVKPGSMGRALPGMPVVLIDPVSGEPAELGEICLDLSANPVGLMTGYRGDPELDVEAITDGYHHTGDIAARDTDGYLTYLGRADDMFKASTHDVSPIELERVLIEHPAVGEVAVVPAPDPLRAIVPKAYVALAAGWTPDRATALAILEHTREKLAPHLRVGRLEFTELPKTLSGKIRRVELRGRDERAARTGAVPAEWRDDQFPELRSSGPDRIRDVQAFIEQHIGDPELDPAKIAREFYMSTRSLHRLFARSGSTVSTWIKHRRLEACRRALGCPTWSSVPISQIASRYGFSNPTFFSREFSAHYRLSPRKYRAWVCFGGEGPTQP